jgi:hypothetical protein
VAEKICTEETQGEQKKVKVGNVPANTIVLYEGDHYRVSTLEAGPFDVELEKVEKRDGKWKPKTYVADFDNQTLPSDTFVTVV